MKKHTVALATNLILNERSLAGFVSSPDDYYWNCQYIFECDNSDLVFNDIKNLSGKDIPESTFIYLPCSLQTYPYCNKISVAHSDSNLHFRLLLLFDLTRWQNKMNLFNFVTLLNAQINKKGYIKDSTCFQDVTDYSIELEFIGELSKTLESQIQSLLININTIHKQLLA